MRARPQSMRLGPTFRSGARNGRTRRIAHTPDHQLVHHNCAWPSKRCRLVCAGCSGSHESSCTLLPLPQVRGSRRTVLECRERTPPAMRAAASRARAFLGRCRLRQKAKAGGGRASAGARASSAPRRGLHSTQKRGPHLSPSGACGTLLQVCLPCAGQINRKPAGLRPPSNNRVGAARRPRAETRRARRWVVAS